MIRLRFTELLVVAAALLCACVPHGEAPSVRMDGGSSPRGPDASAARDSGADKDADSDPCRASCSAPTSVCDPATKTCVQCLERDDCKSPAASRCNIVTHACEACRANNVTDCDGVMVDGLPRNLCIAGTCRGCREDQDCGAAASVCENNLCVPCRIDAQCQHVADRPLCDTGRCARCAGPDDCEGRLCDRLNGVCTMTPPGAAGLCETCVATAQCAIGVCAPEKAVDGAKYRCLPLPSADGECPAVGPRQYRELVKRITAERAPVDACVPGVLSCTEFSIQGAQCRADADCSGVGQCVEGLCGLRCDVDTDCPEDRFCRTVKGIDTCVR